MSTETDFSRLLELEEEYIQKMCEEIVAVKPDLVITEKGVSGIFLVFYGDSTVEVSGRMLTDLAQHFLMKHNITAIRRVRKTDNNRIARFGDFLTVHEYIIY